ncbi:MAG TPA: alanine--tRNA ligase, partial [Ktedonobacterales bacterium]|nr:alanine--tRNA ligase [Ktedonobacterales bacterium]
MPAKRSQPTRRVRADRLERALPGYPSGIPSGIPARPSDPTDQTDNIQPLPTSPRSVASMTGATSSVIRAANGAASPAARATRSATRKTASVAATDAATDAALSAAIAMGAAAEATGAQATAMADGVRAAGKTAKSGKGGAQANKAHSSPAGSGTGGASASASNGASSGASSGASKPLTGAEIRETFLRFFEERGHQRLPSASLIPNDPTVLLTIAGMQQMIPYFLGQEQPPRNRLTTVQKVFRTVDIDEVGDDSHNTFFEMLGNFSVGDYFKEGAIAFAWELLTKVYGIPAERLFPTVHPDDAESPPLWQKIAGIPDETITRLSDNWWGPPGDRGPCGPDSEIYYDFGPEYGCGRADCAPGCEHCDRYLEIWNLVFMQYYQDAEGVRTPLQHPNIDTGMGLERLTTVLQGKHSSYDTDLFRTIIDAVAQVTGTAYGENEDHDRALRVIADHGRGLTFLAGDGVLPSNTGRGYVFRRVLRRAARFGKVLGLDRPFLGEVADVVIKLMGSHYTELVARRDQIVEILTLEERKFNKTLATGLQLLTRQLDELAQAGTREVPGELAFRLFDTHGFPLELTEEIAHERGFTVDRVGYDSAMLRQRERAREQNVFVREREEEAWTQLSKGLPATIFTGYSGVNDASRVVALLVNDTPADEVSAPDTAALVLTETPFYAEMGGQVGDRGVIGGPTGLFEVRDTQRPVPGLIVHYGQMIEGHLRVDSEVRAQVDLDRRRAIMRNHSATHLLHRALKDILGDQVNQKGSLVAPDRLRFDFNLPRAMTTEELRELDRRVSGWILDDLPVTTTVLPYKEAIMTGAMALFGEKYGDEVRVVTMGTSRELCGGIHVAATGQIGPYLTTQEAGVGANIRRIEALTGTGADTYLRSRNDTVTALTARLRTTPDDLISRVNQFQEELTEVRRQLAEAQRRQAREEAAQLAASATDVRGVPLVAATVSPRDDRGLRELGDAVRQRLGSGVVLLATQTDGQARFVVMIDAPLTARGLDAGKIASKVSERLGGKGG